MRILILLRILANCIQSSADAWPNIDLGLDKILLMIKYDKSSLFLATSDAITKQI